MTAKKPRSSLSKKGPSMPKWEREAQTERYKRRAKTRSKGRTTTRKKG